MTQRAFIKELKTESLIHGKGYLFEVAQGIYEEKNKRAFLLKDRVDAIVKRVEQVTGLSISDMCSDRKQENIKAKYIAIHEAYVNGFGTQKNIAEYFGLTDRTTVVHAIKSFSNQYDTNKKYRALVDKIRNS